MTHATAPTQPMLHQQKQNNPQATVEMCMLCFDVLLLKLHQRSHGVFTPDLMTGMPLWTDPRTAHVETPLFVTWDIWTNGRWELRGCIGSLSPLRLDRAITKYALTSALQDRRFAPIVPREIVSLRAKVSLLVQYEPCADCYDWLIGVHGIMIEWTETIPNDPQETETVVGYNNSNNAQPDVRRYSATYLPEVATEQEWDLQQAVESLIRKAGYQGSISPALLAKIKCTRYQSSKCAVDFRQYCQIRQQQEQEMAGAAAGAMTADAAAAVTTESSHTLEAYQLAVAAAASANGSTANCIVM